MNRTCRLDIRFARALALAVLAVCGRVSVTTRLAENPEPPAADGTTVNTLTEQEMDDGWELLFDGETMDKWRGYRQDGIPKGWAVEDGCIVQCVLDAIARSAKSNRWEKV